MTDKLETDIRMALDAKAHEVDVPVDLAHRTIQAAEAIAKPSLRDRLRARADAWRLRSGVTGYPRWAYAGAAGAMAALLFVVGSVVQTRPMLDQPVAETAVGVDEAQTRQAGAPIAEDADAFADQKGSVGAVEPSVGGGGGGSSGAAQIAPVPPEPPIPSRPGQFPPKIVRTANAQIEVRSFETAWDRANGIARKYRGFVTNSQAGLERGTVTMRIPADSLDDAMDDLRKLGKVVSMDTSAEDVSAQIVDIDARVRALEAEELQLLELLRRASGVSQTLEVRDRLNAVRQEIESFKAQKEYFTNAVEYSTINATVYESGADDPENPDDGVLIEAWRTALRVGLTIVAGALVVLGGLVPLVLLGVALWFIVGMARRRRA